MKKTIILIITLPFICMAESQIKAISLSPAVTDIVIAIGGKSNLISRSSACDAPEAKDIPVAGDMGKPFVEPVIKSGAKIILSDTRAPGPQWELLKKCGISIHMFPTEKVDDLPRNIRHAGMVLSRCKEAEKLVAEVEKILAELKKNMPERRLKALVVLGLPPVVSCGSKSFITEALQLAGIENISGNISKDYFVLNTEFIHAAQPEIIISFSPPEATGKFFSRSEYRHLPAVKNGKIYYPPINALCRLTPALPQALQELKSTIERDFLQQFPQKAVKKLY